jgi:hypothetical protein
MTAPGQYIALRIAIATGLAFAARPARAPFHTCEVGYRREFQTRAAVNWPYCRRPRQFGEMLSGSAIRCDQPRAWNKSALSAKWCRNVPPTQRPKILLYGAVACPFCGIPVSKHRRLKKELRIHAK